MNKVLTYLDELNTIDEHIKIEAKECSNKIDRSVLETICAFSNEPDLDGGVILLGIGESQSIDKLYEIVGIEDSDKLQKDLASQCADMFNHPIRPLVEVETVDNKKVIIITVQELDNKYKPLYFKNEKLPSGAWRRIGSTDQKCSEEDLHVFYADTDGFDKGIAEDTDLDDIDENAVKRYRQLREKVNAEAEELNYNDKDLLRALKAIAKDKEGNWKLTNTGLLVFGKQMALRREMPAVRVDYIRVPGTEWVADPHHRFDSIDMRGPMMLMVSRAFNAIADDLPRGFSISPGNLQADRPLSIPEDALREAIVNALIHQSLRTHRPIQIIRYSNRIEITNAGFSLKPEDTLGEPGSEMRNPTIGSIFHDTQLAEAKGTGIGTMRKLMKDAGMMPPTFESDRGKNIFTTRILLHHFLSKEDITWFSNINIPNLSDHQKTALIFLREVGAIDSLTYRQLSGLQPKKVTFEIKQLERIGLLEMKGHGRKTYYVPSKKLKELFSLNSDGISSNISIGLSNPNDASLKSNDVTSVSNDASLKSNDATLLSNDASLLGHEEKENISILPEELKEKLQQVGKRLPQDKLDEIIVELCRVKAFSVEELAHILKRTESHIRNRAIPRLLKNKRLAYTIPEMINHPNQKYMSIKN